MPRVRPRTSWAPLADLSQTPACIALFLSVRCRASEMISAITNSTTLRVLENGALKTAVPLRDAAGMSIWLVPMQKAPMASSSGHWSSTARVTFVFDRIPSSCTPGRAVRNSSSSSAPLTLDTSMPRSVSKRSASGWMFSSSRAFMFSSLVRALRGQMQRPV